MSLLAPTVQRLTPGLHSAEHYEPLTGAAERERLGSRAKESVREKFLMSRLLEDWLDLLAGYERPACQ